MTVEMRSQSFVKMQASLVSSIAQMRITYSFTTCACRKVPRAYCVLVVNASEVTSESCTARPRRNVLRLLGTTAPNLCIKLLHCVNVDFNPCHGRLCKRVVLD